MENQGSSAPVFHVEDFQIDKLKMMALLNIVPELKMNTPKLRIAIMIPGYGAVGSIMTVVTGTIVMTRRGTGIAPIRITA